MRMRYLAFVSTWIFVTFLVCISYENGRTLYYYFKGTTNIDYKVSEEHLHVIRPQISKKKSVTRIYDTTRAPELIPEAKLTHLIYKLQNQNNSRAANRVRVVNITFDDDDNGIIKSNGRLDQNFPIDQRRRVSRIKQVCRDKEIFRDLKYRDKNSTFYYYSQYYGFSYCKVPKSGSTFWTQAFYILENGIKYSEKVFAKSRASVHNLMKRFTIKFNSQKRKHSLSILVSRDPFSRLYSAFIDKSFLFFNKGLNKAIIRHRSARKTTLPPDDITFQEFLDLIILRVKKGLKLNRHWAPIYSLCRPCDVNAYILVKQESFSNDVEQALKVFNVPDEKLATILTALHEHRMETTLPGVIRTVIRINSNKSNKKGICLFGQRLMERIWTSFKIQGYLKENIEFPSKLFTNKSHYENASYVTDVILNAINRNKMTSLEAKRQRHKALVDAYSNIKSETLEEIIDIYKLDFKMFNYSKELPQN